MSLTGDALTDRLVPVASRLVCAIRESDMAEIRAAFAEADEIVVGGEGAVALCVVLAAMVPWQRTPAQLMDWWAHRDEFASLVSAGIEPAVAAELIERRVTGGK